MTESAVLEATAAADAEGKVAAAVTAATPAAVTPATPAVPESYALALPEGSLLSPDAIKRVTETAKALKVSTDADAQALLGLANAEASEVIKTYEDARKPDGAIHKATVAQYEAASLAHPSLGNGDPVALEKKAHQAGLVFAQFAPEILPLLKETGWAARAEVILMGARLYEAMGEKALVLPTSTAQPKAPISLYPDGIPLDTGASAAP